MTAKGLACYFVDPDGDVIDVARRPLTVAVDGFEPVAGAVREECRVVIVGVIDTRAGRPVIGKAGLDAGPRETIDVRPRRRDERDVDTPSDRMLLVGLRESEVAPYGETRRGNTVSLIS